MAGIAVFASSRSSETIKLLKKALTSPGITGTVILYQACAKILVKEAAERIPESNSYGEMTRKNSCVLALFSITVTGPVGAFVEMSVIHCLRSPDF
jgi:hypothetical protein